MKIHDILAALDNRYPLSRAEKWDKVGLLIGDATAEAERVLIAHEVTPAVLEETKPGDALVVYHPMIFRPLENLDFKDHTVRLAAECIRRELAVIAVHTALDNAPPPHALGDALARELGLTDIAVLAPSASEVLLKLVVFVPDSHLHAVSEALWAAGAGAIGNYDRAGFRTRGEGTFRPLEGADPTQGQIGRDEAVEEWRLEVLLPAGRQKEVVRAMLGAHPYEEVAHELYPIQNKGAAYGSARMGSIEPTRLDVYAYSVQQELHAPNVRLVRGASPTVTRIACCPGSGASFLEAAARAGCDCLVTGDFKHHDALKAQALGISVIDTTHVATERATRRMLAEALQGLDVEIAISAVDTNPFDA